MRKKQNIRTDKKCDETVKNSKSPSLKGKQTNMIFQPMVLLSKTLLILLNKILESCLSKRKFTNCRCLDGSLAWCIGYRKLRFWRRRWLHNRSLWVWLFWVWLLVMMIMLMIVMIVMIFGTIRALRKALASDKPTVVEGEAIYEDPKPLNISAPH